MKKAGILLVLGLLCVSATRAQLRYYDAAQFPLIGKINDSTETRYERLPASLKTICRPPVWKLGKNTSGLAIRFRSNSTQIAVKWTLLHESNRLNHMTDTGVKGLDLYAWDGIKWQFVNTARPTAQHNEQRIVGAMLPQEREYMLYLPLYDGITELLIGADSTAYVEPPAMSYPDTHRPIVCYGTSITQGGCATRPGMSYTAILGRALNREVINLGFSGNGQLDYEIARLMTQRTDAALFVLDFIPNVSLEQLKTKAAPFIEILCRRCPNIPILLVESVLFTHTAFDKEIHRTVTDKNNALFEEYQKLRQTGFRNVYYLSSENLIGHDGEATVDGIHLTDVGFMRMAAEMEKTVQEIIP